MQIAILVVLLVNAVLLSGILALFGGMEQTLHILKKGEQRITATLEDIKALMAKIGTDAAAEKAEVSGKIQTLSDKVQALTDQLAQGTAVTKVRRVRNETQQSSTS